MPKKKDIKPKEQAQTTGPHPRLGELAALAFFLTAIFIFISVRHPESTGFLGYWIVDFGFKALFGKAVAYMPVFLTLCGVAMVLPYSKRTSSLLTIGFSYAAFSVFYELITHKEVSSLSWSLTRDGGGWLGNAGLFALQKIVGYQGTWVVLIGVFLLSLILVFNFSFINFGHWCYKKAREFLKHQRDLAAALDGQATESMGFLEKLKYILFYKKEKVVEQNILFPNESEPATLSEFELEPEPELITTKEKSKPSFKIPDMDELTEEKPISVTPAAKLSKEAKTHKKTSGTYHLPPLTMLAKSKKSTTHSKEELAMRKEQAQVLEMSLKSFNVDAHVVNITPGPAVTRFELKPGSGVKIAKITSLSKDIALKLSAPDVRIEAPIPGKALVGIEVPNTSTDTITLRTLLNQSQFFDHPSKLLVGMGLSITGDSVYMDLSKMPHVLIAGATGSGKSVCINTIILSILMKSTPDEVKFLMIDPKKVELSLYENIPHLLAPVVVNPHLAAATLKQWALAEMESRYDLFSQVGVKNLEGYNQKMKTLREGYKKDKEKGLEAIQNCFPNAEDDSAEEHVKHMHFIVVVIDELADLMMVASQEVENTICRLAQMARATGIHLVIATQRPSVNVVTGLIKANVPSRISFFLQSQIDSRTIIDTPGAEKLLGKGDMLYMPVGAFKPKRVQGVFVSEKEVKDVVTFWREQGGPNFDKKLEEVKPLDNESPKSTEKSGQDELFEEAKELVKATQHASTSYLQRKLRIGYNRAARLMDELEKSGIISDYQGEKKARKVL